MISRINTALSLYSKFNGLESQEREDSALNFILEKDSEWRQICLQEIGQFEERVLTLRAPDDMATCVFKLQIEDVIEAQSMLPCVKQELDRLVELRLRLQRDYYRAIPKPQYEP